MADASPIRFCADVHLGKLARLLRMLGFDTVYRNNFSKRELCETAVNEQRCLLSKSPQFKKIPWFNFYQVENADPNQQLKEVIDYYHLRPLFHPFSRCLYCNEMLMKKEKREVENVLLPQTKMNFTDFWKCPSCQKIFWKGSHYERMVKMMKSKFGWEGFED